MVASSWSWLPHPGRLLLGAPTFGCARFWGAAIFNHACRHAVYQLAGYQAKLQAIYGRITQQYRFDARNYRQITGGDGQKSSGDGKLRAATAKFRANYAKTWRKKVGRSIPLNFSTEIQNSRLRKLGARRGARRQITGKLDVKLRAGDVKLRAGDAKIRAKPKLRENTGGDGQNTSSKTPKTEQTKID